MKGKIGMETEPSRRGLVCLVKDASFHTSAVEFCKDSGPLFHARDHSGKVEMS